MEFRIKQEELEWKKLGLTLLFSALGAAFSAWTSSGIYFDGNGSFILAILLLAVLNAGLKPFLVSLTLPFVLLTFGIGLWFINGLLFMGTASVVPGFHVETFASALWGAFCVSLSQVFVYAVVLCRELQIVRIYRDLKRNRPPVVDKDDHIIDI